MKEVKDILEAYDKLTKPKEVTIDMSDFWKERHEKEMKDISKFYSCNMISPYKVKRNVTGNQYEFKAFLKGKEVTLILSENKLTKETFGNAMCTVNNAFYMMNESHQKLNKDFDKAFKAKVIELDKKFDWNNRN